MYAKKSVDHNRVGRADRASDIAGIAKTFECQRTATSAPAAGMTESRDYRSEWAHRRTLEQLSLLVQELIPTEAYP